MTKLENVQHFNELYRILNVKYHVFKSLGIADYAYTFPPHICLEGLEPEWLKLLF